MNGNKTIGQANYLTKSNGEWIHFGILMGGTDCDKI